MRFYILTRKPWMVYRKTDKGYKEKVHEQVKNKKCQYVCKNLKSWTSTVTTTTRKQHLLKWQELKKISNWQNYLKNNSPLFVRWNMNSSTMLLNLLIGIALLERAEVKCSPRSSKPFLISDSLVSLLEFILGKSIHCIQA